MVAKTSAPRERILSKALELFYRQGYAATGVNQIITEAEVARASFYDHFPSKEDLLLAYALETSRKEVADLRNAVQVLPTARARFFGPLDVLTPWFESTGYRGCPFQNLMAEVPPNASRVYEVARQHRESVRMLLREVAFDLKNAEPEFAHIDPEHVATTYLLIFEGAIATSVAYHQSWPIEHAKQTLSALLEK